MRIDSTSLHKPPVDAATGGTKPTPSDHDKLVKQAQIWVSQTFFGTLLKQMRQSPFKSELFSGGRGGEAFSELYDQHLAERMARGAGTKLVNSIVRKIEAKSAYQKSRQPTVNDHPIVGSAPADPTENSVHS